MVASRLISLVVAVATASLTGCASVAARSKDWTFEPVSKNEPAKLAFGQAGTDDVDLILWCDAAKHEIKFTPVGDVDKRFGHIMLKSGGQTLELNLRQDDLNGSVGAAPFGAPLLAAFRSTDHLRMTIDAHRWQNLRAKSANGRRQVQSFFDACR